MAYATYTDVQARMTRSLSESEQAMAATLLDDAAVIIDSYNANASASAKLIVSCNLVIRVLGDGQDSGIPIGATQGSMSGLGYSQSWTISSGASGQMYLTKMDKKLLGVGESIGSYSPVEELAPKEVNNEGDNGSISC